MRNRWLVCACALALAVFALSCSSDDEDGGDAGASGDSTAQATTASGSSGSSGGSSSDVVEDPCELLTLEEASTALGQPAAPGEFTDTASPLGQLICLWPTATPSARVVQVSLIQTGGLSEALRRGQYGNAKAQFDLGKTTYTGSESVSGVGDGAFWAANMLHVVKGDAYLQILVGTLSEGRKEATVEVAKHVVGRLD